MNKFKFVGAEITGNNLIAFSQSKNKAKFKHQTHYLIQEQQKIYTCAVESEHCDQNRFSFKTIDGKNYLFFHSVETKSLLVEHELLQDEFFGLVAIQDHLVLYTANEIVKDQYDYLEDLGEGYTGKGRIGLYLADFSAEPRTKCLISDFRACGQPIFVQGGFYFVGIPKTPVPLGLKYCTNRDMFLYLSDFDGKYERVSDLNCRYPVMTPDQKIVFLSSPSGGPHASCASLVVYDTNARTTRVLVDQHTQAKDFNGLYTYSLSKKNLIQDNGYSIVVTNALRSRSVVHSIHLDTGNITLVSPQDHQSWSVLCCSLKGQIVMQYSSPEVISGLVVKSDTIVELDKIQSRTPSKIEFKTLDDRSECFLIQAGNPKMVVMPHGGPHSVFTTEYSYNIHQFLKNGYDCLIVNYTGSTGFGQSGIDALVGKIGSLDVQQVHEACLWAKQKYDTLPYLFGGSHGGFLTAHLLARYPDIYKAGAMRNPVIHVGLMVADSDIPDWCFAETNLAHTSQQPAYRAADYQKMLDVSPIAFVGDKLPPSLVLLGQDDRRVPPSQGKLWIQYCQSRGFVCRGFVFPSTGHALDSLEAERLSIEKTLEFFQSFP